MNRVRPVNRPPLRMTTPPPTRPEYTASQRFWEQTTPWYRRVSARLGLQGKLTLSFMFLLSVALAGSCWSFLNESRASMDRAQRQQAVTLSHAVAKAGETPLTRGDCGELSRIGRELLKDQGIVAAAFYDDRGHLLAVASQDASLTWKELDLAEWDGVSRRHARVRTGETAALGGFLEVTAPVTAAAPGPANALRPGGFVTVCFSRAVDDANLSRIGQMLVLIGASVSLVSFPLVYGLVHRIFLPIRELVRATERIAGGDLDTQVAIHRPDIIGTLARTFNEMVLRIRRQQEDLEEANARLEDANGRLAEANLDLEHKVEQRTAQLERANTRLRSEIAEKEDFLRAVSHDLNAPLRNIAGMAAMLLMKYREKFDEDVIHRLERIQKNVEVETDLITELLELSRIKTRRQKTEPVDLGVLVGEVGGVFENDLRTRQIGLVVDTPLPTLTCERARMRQVFQNLVDNAVKYMGDGSPQAEGAAPVREIHVGCVVRDDEAEFYVRDTGMGIEPEDVDKVFHVFRRGRSASAKGIAGKGVGLASVKSIVETYEGTIWVQSRPGRGSTFRFTVNGKFLVSPPMGRGKAA